MPLVILLQCCRAKQTGKYYVDSTKLEVCHNRRIFSHKVFKEIAQRGKTSTGWFFGFKLHLVLNDQGELMNFIVTPGNRDDRAVVQKLVKSLTGLLFGDRGYISQKLAKSLNSQGLELITRVRKGMKAWLCALKQLLLKGRGLIETAIGQLKEKSSIHVIVPLIIFWPTSSQGFSPLSLNPKNPLALGKIDCKLSSLHRTEVK